MVANTSLIEVTSGTHVTKELVVKGESCCADPGCLSQQEGSQGELMAHTLVQVEASLEWSAL